jgi:DNA polymerase I-like protein with 3'-5' exonuclease and polymerase domains
MDIVTIDFETYYDKEFSLSKITTEQYIRDPRFETIGVGVKVGRDKAQWFSGTDEEVRQFLDDAYPKGYEHAAILCHNTAFDGAILSWRYGIRPKLWFDTLSMARPLHGLDVGGSLSALAEHYKLGAKGTEVVAAIGKRRADFTSADLAQYGRYCCNDVELTYALFRKLGLPLSELIIIDTTLRMYIEPVLELDAPLLTKHLDDVVNRKATLLEDLGVDASALQSNDTFAGLLRALGVEPPMATSKTTGEMTYAFNKTNKDFTALLDSEDERVSSLVAARLGVRSTLEEKRTQRLLSIAERGTLPVMLNYYGAHTGRFSGGDKVNLQNLPRGGVLRHAIRAPKGHTLVAADSSQIEARVLAWVAGEEDLVNAFREGRDVYSEFASTVYRRKITKEDKTERFVGKTCILGLGYGMGASRFRDQLALGMGGVRVNMTETEAKGVVDLYRRTYPHIAEFWLKCKNAIPRMANGPEGYLLSDKFLLTTISEGIRLPNNLSINYPWLLQDPEASTASWYYSNNSRLSRTIRTAYSSGAALPISQMTRLYGGKVTENIVQALARIVVTTQMLAVSNAYRVVLQVHDENVLCVPDEDVADASADLRVAMSSPPSWAKGLPVACDLHTGRTFGECK